MCQVPSEQHSNQLFAVGFRNNQFVFPDDGHIPFNMVDLLKIDNN